MNDPKKEDEACHGALAKVQSAIKKFLGVKTGAKLVSTPPPAASQEFAAQVQAHLEKQLGHPVTLIPIGHIEITACTCRLCQMRAKAQWN